MEKNIRKCNRDHQRICNCGSCKTCKNREIRNRFYRKHRERICQEKYDKNHPSDDVDESKMNTYWEKVKTNDDRNILV